MKIILLILFLVFSVFSVQADDPWLGWDNPLGKDITVTGDWTFSGSCTFSDDVTFSTDINIGEWIYHDGDLNTSIRFTTDALHLAAGDIRFIWLSEISGQDLLKFGATTTDIDYQFETNGNTTAFFIQGSDGNVGINKAAPGVKLVIEGGISIGDTTGFVLASAAATITSESNVILDTEGAAALDTVTTLTGVIGQIIYISSRVDARDVRFLDAGNFLLGGERTLNTASDVLVLKATSATTWKEVSYVDN